MTPTTSWPVLQHHPYHIDALMAMFELHRQATFISYAHAGGRSTLHANQPLLHARQCLSCSGALTWVLTRHANVSCRLADFHVRCMLTCSE